ncbi:solute carrier family 2, facilitated glucose transporter member 5 [Protopterus annectens]|uniref:solute carrier family 2, facilitated glucose transporter member 5 n=1 Tax=Protopterus annectens TaxID=7888 RepID=UPI001CFB57CC|nr:solute carrier family 2, facilitated glucose transporter member 5 [Protopterus annectens]
MYLGELSPKNLRGAIGVMPQLLITVGILVAQIVGIRSILGNEEGWPLLLGLTGIPAALELICLPFFPESPRFLLIQKGDEGKAKEALKKLRGWDDVDNEIREIKAEDEAEKAEGQISILNLCQFKFLRWQIISVIAMNMGQQLSGINAIYYYADSIYASAGVDKETIQYVTVGTGSVNVVITLAAVFIVEAAGRKMLLLVGFATCVASSVLLTVALNLQDSIDWMPYISIACVIIYVIGHATGPSPIPYVMTLEMFLQSSRPAAFMVGGSVHWLSNFTVGLIFPFMEDALGPYCFIIFSVICLATFIYILIIVPETKKKTFLEVSQLFAKRNGIAMAEDEKNTDVKLVPYNDNAEF